MTTAPDTPAATVPTYRWRCAPAGLATRRQLRARGLRPGGQDPVAEITCRSRLARRTGGTMVGYLYRVDLAQPVRPMTPGRARALAAAMAARRTCPACRRDAGYVIPTSLGTCWPCSSAA
ncbi:RRQRL motif-containing zinc-binding protein [Kitasatospora sp. KL5]|uniref:RRQRL motif-containing zinc-binding protein n=1 Tax=Kitasatospora sp. KL5 TaxID=3425125 RepID=UPI003D6FCF45